MTNQNWNRSALVLFFLLVIPIAPAQIFHELVQFEQTNGYSLNSSLVQGFDGNLYGATVWGGDAPDQGNGTVFRMTPSGTLTTIYSFCQNQQNTDCPNGEWPYGGLALGTDGNFYGVTVIGGNLNCPDYSLGCGTVFKITPTGALTVLHLFDVIDGGAPKGPLALGLDNSFHGATTNGPTNGNITCDGGCGTLFNISSDGGAITSYHGFCLENYRGCPSGYWPQPLMLASDGNYYGATYDGGDLKCAFGNGCGTIFRISPSGEYTVLHTFHNHDGEHPQGPLVEGIDGHLYGTTILGGANQICYGNGCGTVFKMTLSGQITTLHSFDGNDGYISNGGLIQGTDGNFYGTTYQGGNNICPNGCGTLFKITPTGTFTELHLFDENDGAYPMAGLFQATNGIFYGTTEIGGDRECNPNGQTQGCGTVFSVDASLNPFVAFVQSYGKIGAETGILGQGLSGATAVSFNGIPAQFAVKSDTLLRATVPNGATTGYVSVTTSTGGLQSNVPFHVIR